MTVRQDSGGTKLVGKLWMPLSVNYPDDPRIVVAGERAELLFPEICCLMIRCGLDGVLPAATADRLVQDSEAEAAINLLMQQKLILPISPGFVSDLVVKASEGAAVDDGFRGAILKNAPVLAKAGGIYSPSWWRWHRPAEEMRARSTSAARMKRMRARQRGEEPPPGAEPIRYTRIKRPSLWVPLDANFPSGPKVAAAGLEATILFMRALCWSKRQKTEGILPYEALPYLSNDAAARAAILADESLELFVDEPAARRYVIPSWFDWNLKLKDADKKREQSRVRAQRYLAARAAREVLGTGGLPGRVTRIAAEDGTLAAVKPVEAEGGG